MMRLDPNQQLPAPTKCADAKVRLLVMMHVMIVSALAGAVATGAVSFVHASFDDEMNVVREREAAGEPCAVCGVELGPGENAVQVKGRWVPLHDGGCSREFEANPAAVFATMQPRGALFDETFQSPSPLRWTWFFAGGYVLLGLLCGGLASHMAYPRGRSPRFWFAVGLAFNIVAIMILASIARPEVAVPPRLGKLHDTSEPAWCAVCGAGNHPSARRCLTCGASIVPTIESEALRAASGRS